MTPITVPQVSVVLMGMDDKKAAIFKMAFKMYHGADYEICETDTPRLVIVDTDTVGSEDLWKKCHEQYPDAAKVLCSLSAPIVEAAYLPKPIKVETLFPVLIAAMSNEVTHKPTEADIQAHEALKNRQSAYFAEDGEEEIVERVFEKKEDVKIFFFDPKQCLLGKLMAACQEQQTTALLFEGKPVLMVFPDVEKILLAMPPQDIESICKLDKPEIEVRYIANNPEWKEHATEGFSACIWQFSIWTTQGRLIKNIMPSTLLHLQRWPNITRLAYIPNAMRLAAFLVKAPASVNVLYKILRVDLNDILTFVTASYCIGLLKPEEQNTTQSISKNTVMVTSEDDAAAESAAQIMAKKAAKNHGSILKRLLKKLTSN